MILCMFEHVELTKQQFKLLKMEKKWKKANYQMHQQILQKQIIGNNWKQTNLIENILDDLVNFSHK